jgi:DNA-binding transcriptional ArsR family regulator
VDFELASARLRAMGHPTRLRILELLARSGCCVGEIERQLDLRQSNVSQHLRVLRDCGLVSVNRQGQTLCYTLNEPLVSPLLETLETQS